MNTNEVIRTALTDLVVAIANNDVPEPLFWASQLTFSNAESGLRILTEAVHDAQDLGEGGYSYGVSNIPNDVLDACRRGEKVLAQAEDRRESVMEPAV